MRSVASTSWLKIRKFKNNEDEVFNMTRAWDKEKLWVPDGNRTHGLPDTGWVSGRPWVRTQNFSLSRARVMLNTSSSLFITELKIYHLYYLLNSKMLKTGWRRNVNREKTSELACVASWRLKSRPRPRPNFHAAIMRETQCFRKRRLLHSKWDVILFWK